MSLREILAVVARLSGRTPPTIRLPRWSVYPIAFLAEFAARFSGGEPRVTVDGVRMSAKHMYYSSQKAERELAYRWRAPDEAISDAIEWFKAHGVLE